MKRFIALFAAVALAGCSTGQVASTVATANGYQQSVLMACSVAKASADAAATTSANADVARAALLVHASCDSEAAIASLFLSPTSVAWLNTLITTINSFGKIVPPAPITAPAAKA